MLFLIYQALLLAGLFGSYSAGVVLTITRPKHPPAPTATFPPLSAQFRRLPVRNQACWKSHYDYSFTSHWLMKEFAKSSTRIATTFSPPRSGTSYYTYDHTTNCETTLFGTSTLCDKIPRASGRSVSCETVPTVGSYEYYEYMSEIAVITPTWTSDYEKPKPTCQVAPDLSPLCAAFFEAWEYRKERWQKENSNFTERDQRTYWAIPPCIPLTEIPPPNASPRCKISAETYSAYHWADRAASGSEFCNQNRSAATVTPTIPGKPNTVVVSGYTLTSPSVYHFLRKVQVQTYIGLAEQPGGFGPQAYDVWTISTALPGSRPLTVAQLEPEILTASKKCIGIEGDICTMNFDTDFLVDDVSKVRKEKYDRFCDSECLKSDNGYILQNSYRPTIAIPISEIIGQNGGLFSDCGWTLRESNYEHGWRSYTESSIPALLVKDVASTAFVPLTASTSPTPSVKLVLAPGSKTQPFVRPTS
ncbi:hypothetical protein BU24DRAFT_411693 [Aaosphaeria arxii CBS 175.79]|uniref:Uncharacterized protein n=1 Tax=Aaosphaeria arxii CBS 175.79 TaxID=1450172 RepID=A0A6A5XM73_9PLEO|nr:uncharacterized protein BU24DRAFT_411693 [Aaosphaeria arxii CBS 175.79]KAF2014006.1 hypothetical protein BU24DRAFT_411693 [Aaosphaeria arxii CBS 175.79]